MPQLLLSIYSLTYISLYGDTGLDHVHLKAEPRAIHFSLFIQSRFHLSSQLKEEVIRMA